MNLFPPILFPGMTITFQDLITAAQKLNSEKQNIDQRLIFLRGYISNLVSCGFVTNQASVKFNESYMTFTQGALQTMSGLDDMAAYLREAAREFQEIDQQLAAGLG